MNEAQEKAAADLDALWGVGTAESAMQDVERAQKLCEAAEKLVLVPGLRVPKSRCDVAALAVASCVLPPDAGLQAHMDINVSIDIDLKAAVDDPAAEPVYNVFVPGMTEEQAEEAKRRLQRHDALMLAAMLIEQQAKKALTGD